jgi:hypothetical protein
MRPTRCLRSAACGVQADNIGIPARRVARSKPLRNVPAGWRLTRTQMQPYQACLQRLAGPPKWFVTIRAAVS